MQHRGTVLITGCSSGFGYETAIECAKRGYRVYATMRSPEQTAPQLLEATRGMPGAVAIRRMDVTDERSVCDVVAEAAADGDLEAVVNNAGVGVGGLFQHTPDEELRRTFETNVFGLCAVTRAAIPHLRARRRGTIVMISSASGRLALPMMSVYAASKHAVEGISESLRTELAPYNVAVVLIEPGAYKTAMHANRLICGAQDSFDGEATTRVTDSVQRSAARFGGDPRRVARRVAKVIEDDRPRLRHLMGPNVPLVAARRFVPQRLYEWGGSLALRRAGYGRAYPPAAVEAHTARAAAVRQR
jgi:NAD(P)-dependent dehydrogenase (short-subunit alcohol dehydrogenase family)